MLKEKNTIYSVYAVLAATLYFIFFQHLDSFHIRDWDESMFAVNAYEMSHNHRFIVPYYKNLPDLWNSKPPLQLWLQVFFIKIMGFNELAVRLPSALASSFSALALFHFFKKRTSLSFALSVFLVFVSCKGVSAFHAGRTGDSDALLSFLILCYLIEFYKWIIEGKASSAIPFFVFLTLAFLTKSIAALLFIPALVFVILYLKKIGYVFGNKWFYIGSVGFLAVASGYILLREHDNPGYINYVLHNDFGRVHTIIESHEEPFDFYLNHLFEGRFSWILLSIPGAIAMYINQKTRMGFIYLIALFTCYFFIISYSSTKLEWYDLPLFPILSVFSAFALYQLLLKMNPDGKHHFLLLSSIFILPVYFSCRSSYKSEIDPGEKKLEALTEYAFKHSKDGSLKNTTFLVKDYDRSLFFYKYKLQEKGLDFEIGNSTENLKTNSFVIVSDDSLKKEVMSRYLFAISDSIQTAWKVEIKGIK